MSGVIVISLGSDRETLALGARLAKLARRGDVIALRGALGAGKTTLARGFIQALAPHVTEVPSPTFTLVQTYDDIPVPVFHFDLYRLNKPEEIDELGLDDAEVQGIVLIEWPERLGARLPSNALDVALEPDGDGRRARMTPSQTWRDRLKGFV